MHKLSGLIISDFTIDVLGLHLNRLPGTPQGEVKVASFVQTVPLLNNPSDVLWKDKWDFLVVWDRLQAAVPSFRKLLDFDVVSEGEIIADCDRYIEAIRLAAGRSRFVFVMNWALPEFYRGYGPIDLRPSGWQYTLQFLNLHLARELAGTPNVYVLPVDRWLRRAGEKACDPRLWFMGKIPYDPAVFKFAAEDIRAALRACLGQSRKLIILDLDNTLWGGVVGDDGWEKICLGGHDARGESFVEFQRLLKAYQRRGIVLAVASKNQEDIAWQAFERHPEMILRKSDISAWRINWEDKAENIRQILRELNLPPESAIFIDDNPVERGRVAEVFPGLLVPAWPQNTLLYSRALLELDCFDTAVVSEDDRQRTRMYEQERSRNLLREQTGSQEEWLASLKTVVRVSRLNMVDLPRATQLLNKTNQMNLSTRRLSEPEFWQWSTGDGRLVLVFRVEDKLGHSGLTGIASLEHDGKEARIVDLVLSCRVFGRHIENVMLQRLVAQAVQWNMRKIRAVYLPTPKNAPCLEFLNDRSGFLNVGDNCFEFDTTVALGHIDSIAVTEGES